MACNEEDLIDSFLERALAALEESVSDYGLILVDGGRTDRTNEIAQAHKRDPHLRVITNERNMNIGTSFKRALASARKEFLFWQTVDWSCDLTPVRVFFGACQAFRRRDWGAPGLDAGTAAQRGRLLFYPRAALAERLHFLEATKAAHSLADPVVYAQMKPVLGRWRQAFPPIFEDGRGAVCKLRRRR